VIAIHFTTDHHQRLDPGGDSRLHGSLHLG